MTVAILASPAPPPPDYGGHPGWNYIESSWTDWTGRVWDLTDPDGGVFLIRSGVRGLGALKPNHHRDQSPAVAGSFWRGVSYDSREVYWPVYLFSDKSSLHYIELDRAWWRGLNPRKTGTWAVRTPDSGTRYLDLRMEDDGGWAPELDPTFFGWSNYGITLIADRPWWRGEVLKRTWGGGVEERDFSGGTTDVVYISSGNTLGGAAVSNPGDEPAWGKWTVTGPATSITLTLGGQSIVLPYALAAGRSLTIDTNPTANTVTRDDGGELFAALTAYNPLPIPPVDEAGTVDVGITIAGSSSATRVDLEFTPLYHRAW